MTGKEGLLQQFNTLCLVSRQMREDQCVKEIIKLINLIKNQIMIIWFDFN
jgi:hypothetical protein